MSKLLMTPATAQEDSINKMWSVYMKESEEYDKHVTDVWRKDTSDILIFVSSYTLIIAVIVTITLERLLCSPPPLPPFSLKAIKSCYPILATNLPNLPPPPSSVSTPCGL